VSKKLPKKTLPNLVVFLFSLNALGIVIVTVMSLLGKFWWVFDVFTHFHLQYCWLVIPGIMLFSFVKSYRWAVLSIFLLLFNFAFIMPYYLPLRVQAMQSERPQVSAEVPATYQIMFANILATNQDHQKIAREVRRINPDVAMFVEVSDGAYTDLQKALPDYPYQYLTTTNTPFFQVAIFSRFPFDGVPLKQFFGGTPQTALEARLKLPEGRSFTIIGIHPTPPASKQWADWRDTQFTDLAGYLAVHQQPVMVVGDFNASPWSAPYQQLLKDSHLKDSRDGFGVQPSWPSNVPVYVRIPIDQILISSDIAVTDRFIGEDVGSDHLPVNVKIQLK
jgi:endonuclease/exonuclease/phosphatase (EEP) superfamily protein YafD